jgi:peptidase A4-like protein
MDRSVRYVGIIAVVSILALASLPAFALAAPAVTHPSVVRLGSGSSTNWSGYAVTGPSGSVSDVKGSWIVPAIVGPCPSTNQYSSHWVGIDGFSSNTVEQTGTDSDCQNGAPAYYVWYEFYPHASYLVKGLTIHPGDHISAEVHFTGKQFTITITDTTTGHTYSTSSKVTSAHRSSAEWITEAPYSGGVLPLADFGTINWGLDNTGIASTNYATVSGVTGAIGSFGSSVQSITMVTSGGATKASPSALSSDGTSFSINWVSAGP